MKAGAGRGVLEREALETTQPPPPARCKTSRIRFAYVRAALDIPGTPEFKKKKKKAGDRTLSHIGAVPDDGCVVRWPAAVGG